MTPLDLMIWALAALVAVACFVLVVMLLNALVRSVFRKRPPQKSGHAIVLDGSRSTDSVVNAHEIPSRRGEQR
ncbi:hypothetical protein D8M34_06105 [Microbacterium sp. HSID17254]|uniref:hypothetical protein n=1 Tax=Microbacterium sp. HSID17254 TaxID=2419509 RepID=UPI000F872061|nr:hypothetical protein [Microbacterium sp. HSID17254]RUQ07041.1 hypothetical protein D8M34_06105 [Microbacterium sp. HSID17254]